MALLEGDFSRSLFYILWMIVLNLVLGVLIDALDEIVSARPTVFTERFSNRSAKRPCRWTMTKWKMQIC